MQTRIKPYSPLALGLAAALAAPGAPAAAADFDYWLLALTWSPSWCRDEARPGAEQCDPDRDLGFTLHGLWPQYEDGWPEDCTSAFRDPTRRQTEAMADVMGSGSLAWYQWKKHGRCAGLPPDRYFDTARLAFATTALPAIRRSSVTAEALEQGFIAANPGLAADDVVVTCSDGAVREVRICLDADLSPRGCGPDVLRQACRARGALDMPPAP